MKKLFTLFTVALILGTTVQAQLNVGGNSAPNANAMLEVSGSTKGLLLPRVELEATNSASPMNAFVAGMHVYNTATAGSDATAVSPGEYYSDGASWLKVIASASGKDKNIYDGDDMLAGNRTVTMADKNLTFSSTTGNLIFNPSSTGNVGIGTTAPGSKMEINSGTANTSGLKFTNLTSSTTVSSGASLGVDANGNVITVPGSAFTPAYGREVLGTTINIAGNTTSYNILNFTLPAAGTYLITYSVRGETQATGGYGYLTSFLSTSPVAGAKIPDTEILIFTSNDASRAVLGGTGTGTLIVSVTEPTTYYVGIKAQTLPCTIYNNADGRTSVSFVKITP